MNIEELTIGQAKELVKLFGGNSVYESHSKNPAIGKYCIIRCQKAGVHAGTVTEANPEFIVLKDSRRLWYWKSKFTLSEVANSGIDIENSKIATVLDELIIPMSDVGEMIPTTQKSRKSIEEAKIYVP